MPRGCVLHTTVRAAEVLPNAGGDSDDFAPAQVYALFDDVLLLTDGCALGMYGHWISSNFVVVLYITRHLHANCSVELFDPHASFIILLRRKVMFHGPVDQALPFFQSHLGFECPVRKDAASFLQEVTTPKGDRMVQLAMVCR
jgi:hypothetical protein